MALLRAKVDAQLRAAMALTEDEEEDALDRILRIRMKHLDMDKVVKGEYPDRLIAEWAAKGGWWKLVALIADSIRKFL